MTHVEIHTSVAAEVHPGPFVVDDTSPVPPDKKLRRKRFSLDLTSDQHRDLKGQAVKAGLTMRVLILQLLHREGLIAEWELEPELGQGPESNEEASKA